MTQPKNGFQLVEKQDAPEASKPLLDQVEQGFGFLPNIFKVFAPSPAATQAYLSLNDAVRNKSALSAVEQEVAMLAISAKNGCGYCVAAHTGGAERSNVDPAVVEALRANRPLPDAKLNALATFAQTMIEKKGWADEADVKAFLDAGYTHQHVLDIVTALAMKTISNYANHLADTPLDEPLKAKALQAAE